ncbi:MAG: hypothetical protein IPJ41_14335 [Phycisphaerales bacterium]|nr:hypothetical protein [Phycisphaerales bacterium]
MTLTGPRRSDMHTLTVRCVPGPAGVARLELGDIIIAASQGRLVAIHRLDPSTYAELQASDPAASPADVLRELLPAIPIPQLSLAFDKEDVRWCPLLPAIRWESAERIEQDGERGVRLRGRSSAGEASLDLVGSRVRRFEAGLDADSGSRLLVECKSVSPGDPANWAIDRSGRRRIAGIGSLKPLGPPVTAGTLWPGIGLTLTPGSQPYRLLTPAPEDASPELHLLLFARSSVDPARFEAIAALASNASRDLRRELLRGRIEGRIDKRMTLADTVCALVAEPGEDILARVGELTPAWLRGVRADATGRAPLLAWSAEDSRPIDRVRVGAEAAAVLVDGRGRVVAAFGIDSESTVERVVGMLAAGLPSLP